MLLFKLFGNKLFDLGDELFFLGFIIAGRILLEQLRGSEGVAVAAGTQEDVVRWQGDSRCRMGSRCYVYRRR